MAGARLADHTRLRFGGDQLLENNERYASGFDKGDLPLPPGRKVAVVACKRALLTLRWVPETKQPRDLQG